MSLIIDTNLHVFLELRQMSEEADVDAGLMIVEDEQMNEEREEKGSQEKSSPLGKCSTVIMTDKGVC